METEGLKSEVLANKLRKILRSRLYTQRRIVLNAKTWTHFSN